MAIMEDTAMVFEDGENCPICNNNTLIEGEKVDVGFGTDKGVQVGPDICEFCRYVEREHDFSHYEKCWELQIDPHPPIPECKTGKYDKKYEDYFLNEVDALGSCYSQCVVMAKAFPELRIVYGSYVDWIWGDREHFWCIDENNVIVDPTKCQFPTRSDHYRPKRFTTIEEIEGIMNPLGFLGSQSISAKV